jgi:hypothetical protein
MSVDVAGCVFFEVNLVFFCLRGNVEIVPNLQLAAACFSRGHPDFNKFKFTALLCRPHNRLNSEIMTSAFISN